MNLTDEKLKYLKLLATKYPSIPSVCREIINLKAILNLPKGTEHFMSDIHGEYEAFYHIMNNAAGVIKEKVDMIFVERMTPKERQEICTLVYYPVETKASKKAAFVDPTMVQNKSKELNRTCKIFVFKIHAVQGQKSLTFGI